MVIHSSLKTSCYFLYVHISRADSLYDPKEMDVIQEKMKGLYPSKIDFDKKLYHNLTGDYKTFDKEKLPTFIQRIIKALQSW